jgi:hypothetical protein
MPRHIAWPEADDRRVGPSVANVRPNAGLGRLPTDFIRLPSRSRLIGAPLARRDLALGVERSAIAVEVVSDHLLIPVCSDVRPRSAMGFLKRILRNGIGDDPACADSNGSFESISDDELQVHMGIASYGVFDLTDAIRPSYDLQIVPRQGYRFDAYVDEANCTKTPVVMASATRHQLMDLFLDLIEPLGSVVDVVLETSHRVGAEHEDLYREHIDMPVLKSILLEYEDLLLNDGCMGIAVINPAKRQEVQLDEHKLLIMYGHPLKPFESILIDGDVYPDEEIHFVTEAEHVHSSSERLFDQFNVLRNRLGMDGEDFSDSW